ncbi:glutathione hydrolase-like YwrD proenzyme [Mytilus edulis]|uniref:glutathione hydrolase-like YwrD proenzyme n=1 Tax=Mytilus edulis TaxID=6550 RepID=UPI0039EF7FD9
MSNNLSFHSRRSPVICSNGCVASSQPLASQIGIDILKSGGNAADAAVAVAAALNVTEPCSTGIGGDAFCLFYDSKSKTVKGLNGSGRCPNGLTLDLLEKQGYTEDNFFPTNHGHAVSIPGAAAAWVDTVERFGSGKLSMSEILKPAAELAEVGFPVQQTTSYFWEKGSHLLTNSRNKHGRDMLIQGRAPMTGEVIRLPHLAKTFKELGTHGKKGVYDGRIGSAISNIVQEHGGVMNIDDLRNHVSTFEDPISVSYKGYRVWEIPPNGQGMCALIALNLLESIDLKEMGANSTQYLHHVIEAIKLGFADTTWYCADASVVDVPISQLLSKDYAKQRRSLIDPNRALQNLQKGNPFKGKDTVYFTTADKDGNACSFINSNFMGFGTGIVPEGCGFTLQNRGYGFSLDKNHPNVLAPNKRPFHTIIPAMVTYDDGGDFAMSYGVMGGYMQPQGHVQVLLNMVEFGMDPQAALDQPRILVGGGYGFDSNSISAEEGISEEVIEELRSYGHTMTGPVIGYDRASFGRGQVIARGTLPNSDSKSNVYWAGTDPRCDGIAIGY